MPSRPYSPSAQELARRRAYLKAKRRFKVYQTTWRSLLTLSFAAGILWLATSPIWLIRSHQQVAVSDNQILSDENIRELLPVPYPQSLIKVQPEDLEQSLKAYKPIASASVSRRLLPPGLHVRVRERIPVAVALPDTTQPLKAIPNQPVPFQEPGLIDAEGYWMPRNSFRDLGAIANPPALTVRGLRPEYKSSWRAMYASLVRTPVTVTAVDWTRPSNVILISELGKVHLGPYGKNFEAQLAALDQMRSLDSSVSLEQVAFIDLQDPDNPIVQVLQATSGPAGIPPE